MTQEEYNLLLIDDFKMFVKHTWEHLRLPAPTRMQYEIADYLQEFHSRMVLQALRGIGKTWLTGAFVCWRLLRNPNEKVLIVSQSGGHSDNIAIFIRKLIDTMDILQHLRPDKGLGHRTSVTAFDVSGCEISVQPSVKALGITSQIQGNRASLLISDDIEGQQNSATEVRREQLRNQSAEFEAVLQTTDDAQIVVLGTPQSAESIYNGFRQDGYYTRIFPARYPEDMNVYDGCLAPYIVEDLANNPDYAGKPIDSRFTDEDLTVRENRYGRSGFKLQFMLDTTLSDAEKYPLKQGDLIVTSLDKANGYESLTWGNNGSIETDLANVGFRGDKLHYPLTMTTDLKPYEGIVLSIDPSGKGSDEMGWAIMAHMLGKLYLLDFGGMKGGYVDTNLMKLAQLAKEYKVNDIVVEENFGGGMFTALLAPVMNDMYPCNIEEVNVNQQKELRIIDTLEPVLNQHRLVIDYSALKRDLDYALLEPNNMSYSLLHQLTHITKERGALIHDDRLDAVTIATNYWLERDVLYQNTDKALEAYRERQRQAKLKDFSKLIGSQKKLFGTSQKGSKTLSKLGAYKAS